MADDLNEVFEEAMQDAVVITVPIDDTLSNSGEAADAKAVGDALALKANASDIASIKVNEQQADNQGQILLSGEDVPVSETDERTIAAAIGAAEDRTAADIAMGASDETTIAEKMAEVETSATRTGAEIPLTDALGAPTVAAAVQALQGAVKTVNGEPADTEGNVSLSRVNLAGNLETAFKASSEGAFLQRSSGGAAAVVDGEAQLLSVQGNNVHSGYVAEIVGLDVQPASADSELAATIDRAVWRSGGPGTSGTYTLLRGSSAWTLNGAACTLDEIGVTITAGTPANGDKIIISYQEEVRGTIAVATPESFNATGWNLYQSATGYAKVVRYSDDYGYKISGAYTALQFAATVGGSRSAITPNSNGIFQVPSDGYVFVTGGNGSTTAIYPTWSDWLDGYPGEFAAYARETIDLSAIMTAWFPYGLLQAGDIRDEISLADSLAINRVDRMEYSAENLAQAVATGRSYEYDESYIYLARSTPATHAIDLIGAFTVSDHGTEFFLGSTVPVWAKCTYSANLKNKLERDVLTISQQSLTNEERAQARANIGAAPAAEVAGLGYYFPDYSNIKANTMTGAAVIDYTADEDCWVNIFSILASAARSVQVNGITVAAASSVTISSTKYYSLSYCGMIHAGDRVVTTGTVRGLICGLKR